MLSGIERNAIYLLLSLPPLTWGEMPAISSEQLKEEVASNVGEKDAKGCYDLFLLYDIENARALWLNNQLGPKGNYDTDELKTHLVDYQGLPPFFANFLDQYPQPQDRLNHFEELMRSYFVYLQKSSYPFIRFWGQLSLRAREAFSLYRAGQMTEDELFHSFDGLFKDKNLKASALGEAVNHFLFDQVTNYLGEDPFDIERVFAYIVQFYLIHLSIEVHT